MRKGNATHRGGERNDRALPILGEPPAEDDPGKLAPTPATAPFEIPDKDDTLVLVSDDDPNIRRLMGYHLERNNFRVVYAENGPQTLERMGMQPDIVLLDLMLPGLDGLQCLEQIRKISAEAKVIMVSAHGQIHQAVEAMKLGAYDYIAKPFETPQLLATVRRAVHQQSLEHAITERTTELQQSEERLRVITEAARDAILMMDPAGNISYWNPAAEKLLGYTSGEALGRHLHKILSPRGHRATGEAGLPDFNRAGAGPMAGKTINLEAVRKDGTEVPVEMSLAPIQIQGEWHAVGILRDVTDRVHHERALRKALDLADAANRSKSEFLANMSHEIRTPMAAVIGLSDLLADTDLDENQREYVRKINISGTALLGVLNDILDYSKMEAGQVKVESVPLRVRDILDKCQTLFSVQAENKGIALRFAVDPEVPPCLLGDPLRFLQVTNNLLSNAMKFTDRGEIEVSVKRASRNAAGATLKVCVKDTGIGLHPEQIGRLFLAFQQADRSTARKYGGTGLGLSISKRLVELMGGEIGVESSLGQGSTFWFTLTLEEGAGTPAASGGTAQPAPPETAQLLPGAIRGARVLLVDDSPTNVLVSKAYLRKLGLEVESAGGGEEAVQKAKAAKFDAILMDLQMPGMDGFTAARIIRADKNPRTARVPIIALTAGAMPEDLQASEAAGMNDHLAKPIEIQKLAATLAKWIPRGR